MKGFINKFWPQSSVDILVKLYPRTTNAEIGKILNKHERAIIGKAFKMKLKKDPEFIRECAKKGQFKKGQIPANKGKRQIDFMSPEAIERTKATRFKKGNVPATAYNEIGKITIRYDHENRNGRPYKYICLALGKWVQLHKHIWEQANGKIPKGLIPWFKDGDTLNVSLENIELITRAEQMARNSGPLNLPDKMVATYLATESRKVDHELKQEYLKHPELINAKRNHLTLNRKIKQHGTK